MDDVERQIKAWADAAAPSAVGAVDAESVMARGAGDVVPLSPAASPARRVLAAAAVVVALVAGAALVLSVVGDDDGEGVRAGQPPGSTDGVTDPSTPPADGEVTFELLNLGVASEPFGDGGEWELPSLRSGSTAEQLDALWTGVRHLDPTRSSTPPLPEVDFAAQVVVAIAIPDDNCPPELVGFRRQTVEDGQPARLIPQFVETVDVCEQPLVPKQYVVALDWASTGDRFSVHVDGGNLSGDSDMIPNATAAEIRLDRARPDPALVDVELDATTVEAGGTLSGQVVVSNNTGEPIDISYCGAEFAVVLENDEVDQQLISDLCIWQGELVPGVSTFEVEVSAKYGSCVTIGPVEPEPDAMVACLPEGRIPPLPPGEYATRLYPPAGLDADAPPVTVTLT